MTSWWASYGRDFPSIYQREDKITSIYDAYINIESKISMDAMMMPIEHIEGT